ncbi:MAG: hypothetical protein FWF15_05305 [Oscillospiraceae bacterium]|nr:hypothetical protein [Oscillospiraceae bacterium]
MKWIIGADGGGTKTSISAKNLDTGELREATGGGVNYNFIGVDAAAENFIDTVAKLNIPQDDEIIAIAIGDPATDDINFNDATNAFVEKLSVLNTKVHIKSDAFMALYGLTKGDAGVLMISGTGAMGIAIDRAGEIFIAGGWGQATQDEGSGYYIAVNGIQAALNYYDGVTCETTLLQSFKKHFGIETPRDFINLYYNNNLSKDLASFAKEVAVCAENGDQFAIGILDNAAFYLIGYTASLIDKIGCEDCIVGIYGSVLLNNNYIQNKFITDIKNKYPKCQIKIPDVSPEMAALEYAENCLL